MAKGGGGVPVGKGYVTIYPKISAKDFTRDLNSAVKQSTSRASHEFQNSVKNTSKSAFRPLENSINGIGIKTISLGNVVGNAITASMGAVKGLTVDAVNRLDTLKQYPKVMMALGYSSEEASRSIKTIQEHLIGLPSTTADISQFVKGIAAAGLPLDKATRLGLGLNDMLLSAGTSSYDASRAFVQFNQMLSSGKVDMQSWKTLAELMPAQLGIIAETLLGAGKNQMDLYHALQDGTVTWEEFTNAIIKGAEEGGAGFDAFAKTAQEGMGGIGTSLSNLKNRFINGMVEVLDNIGQDRIKDTLNGISEGFHQLAEGLSPLLEPLADVILVLADAFGVLLPYLPELIVGFLAFKATVAIVPIIQGVVASFTTASGALSMLAAVGQGAIAVVGGLRKALALLTTTNVIGIIVAIVAALAYFVTQTETGREMWAKFTQFLSDAWNACCEAVMGIVQPVVDGILTAWEGVKAGLEVVFNVIQVAWQVLCEAFNIAWLAFSTPFLLAWEIIKATVSAVIQVIKTVWNGLCSFMTPAFEVVMTAIKALIAVLQATFQAVVSMQAVWNGLCEFLKSIFQAGMTVITAVINALSPVFSAVVSTLQSVWNGLCSFMLSLVL